MTAAALGLALCAPPLHSAVELAATVAANVSLRVMERLTPELTEAPVKFWFQETADQDPFNFDKEPGLEAAAAWQIQVYDRKGVKVAFVQGTGRPGAAAISWDGTGPDGEPLPDGFYEARLVWMDSAGRPRATRKEPVSLVTPLEIRVLAGRNLRFRYTAEGLIITIDEKLIFRPGQSDIQAGALPALDDLRKFLDAHPDNKITVRGYTDSLGARDFNLRLSRERAARVYAYFVSAGIPVGRIAYYGLGPVNPVASNATPEGRARNRRVDVVMLKPEETPA